MPPKEINSVRVAICTIFAFCIFFAGASKISTSSRVEQEIKRTIDVSKDGSPLVFERVEIKLTNENPVDLLHEYVYWIPAARANNVAFMQAFSGDSSNAKFLQIQKDKLSKTKQKIRIILLEGLKPNEKLFLSISAIYHNVLFPEPASIQQSARQNILFQDFVGLGSLYKTKKFEFVLKMPTVEKPLEFDSVEGKQKGSRLTYGPYDHDPIKTPIRVVFFAPKLALLIRKIRREIWVRSMGKTLEFDEWVDVEHVGAKLIGFFNRLEAMRIRDSSSLNIVNGISVQVPNDAKDIFYRDEIGNVSTSSVLKNFGRGNGLKRINFEFRFPLFGGWKYNWNYGYEIDATPFIKKIPIVGLEQQKHSLIVPIAPVIPGHLVEDFELRVVLPEGVKDIEVVVQSEWWNMTIVEKTGEKLGDDSYALERRHYYLDTIGRPVVVVQRRMCMLENNAGILRITYRPTTLSFILKPLLIALTGGAVIFGVLLWLFGSPICCFRSCGAITSSQLAQQKKKR